MDIYEKYETKLKQETWAKHPIIKDFKRAYEKYPQRYDTLARSTQSTLEEVHATVVSSEVAWRALICPQTERQSWQESALREHLLATFPDLPIKILPKGGRRALFLDKGTATHVRSVGNRTKSLDFQIGEDVFIVHKYTRGAGGAQDNQRNDAYAYLSQCRPHQNIDVILCLDGNYYQRTGILDDFYTAVDNLDRVHIMTYLDLTNWIGENIERLQAPARAVLHEESLF